MTLPHTLERTVLIQAGREAVFRYFTDPARWASWWGPGSTIDARPGGRVLIRYPGGVEATGDVLEVQPPESLVFTYGYASGQPILPGASRVTLRLEAAGTATRLRLRHEFQEADVAARDEHVQGWRYQLAVFANVVADEVNARAAEVVDTWFDVWMEPDAARRAETLGRIASPSLRFRDRHGLVDGVEDLLPHVAAAQRFMPGVRLERCGEVRHCQGTVLADWVVRLADGSERGRGTNVFVLGGDGRIESVTGFWSATPGR
jgi:uncharacterized protein YndB with AHSA1/START domain